MERTALVTGAAGFIGSNLCKRLLDLDYRVIGVDNLFCGTTSNLPYGTDKFSFFTFDINKLPEGAFTGKIDEIYNCACPASPKHYRRDPLFTIDTCTVGVRNLLDLANHHNAIFIQFSTSEVYGEPIPGKQSETYFGNVNPLGPRSCYDEGKRLAETICTEYHRKYSTDVRIIRIFNCYGPGMSKDDGRVIPNFICLTLANEPVTVYGSGFLTRSLMYIDDLLDALPIIILKGDHTPVNIGNPNECTVNDIKRQVLAIIGQQTDSTYTKCMENDPTRRCPDISKILDMGWRPKVNLEEGLKLTVLFFKEMSHD